MADYFVFQHARVPRVGQSQQPVETARGFIDRLHGISVHFQNMKDFNKSERDAEVYFGGLCVLCG
jgi:hypothetical protein